MADDSTKLALCGAVSRFLDSSDLSDFIIKCHTSSWNVHRFILCLHSDVLEKWCTGDFKESKNGNVDLSVHDKQHVEALVKYLYTFDYSVDTVESHADKMSFHVCMCVIADKYNIAGLKTLSIKKFNSIINNTKTPDEILQACIIAYDTATATPKIRDSIVALIHLQRELYLPTKASEQSKQLEDVVRSYPDLAIDVVKYTPSRPSQCAENIYRCDNNGCGHMFRGCIAANRGIHYVCPSCSRSVNGNWWNYNCIIR